MRTKKDPGIRQEAFISAATELFMENGYEAVSIRDVLDAVADKTASPSVFYYYFSSKDQLYRACVNAVAHDYISSMSEGFSMDGKTMEQWLISLINCMESYLLKDRKLTMTGKSTPNRLFILDMKEQVTKSIASLWSENLTASFGIPAGEALNLAGFLSGGIGEMMFDLVLKGDLTPASIRSLTETIVRYSMNTIGLPEQQKQQLTESLKRLNTEII